jgi:hypothetical protein
LCHKCNEKYYPSHRCTPQVVKIIEAQEDEKEGNESNEEKEEVVSEEEEEIEEAVVSMFSSKDAKFVKIMKFKGEVRKLSKYVLLDGGALSPLLIQLYSKEAITR